VFCVGRIGASLMRGVRRHIMRCAILIAGSLLSALVLADEPLPRPTFTRFSSPNSEFVAYSTPGSDTRVASSASGETLWRIPDWHRLIYLSNDGNHAAVVYEGLNLIPIDSSPNLVLITLWSRGEKVGEVRLRAIAASASALRKTASHYEWGVVKGFSDQNQLIVERFDGKQFRFSAEGMPQ
jgi:hypothetical protein